MEGKSAVRKRRFPFRLFSITRSYAVFLLQALFILAFVIGMMPFAWLRSYTILSPMLQFWARTIFFIAGKKVTITGIENFDPEKNYLLAANHGSYYDAAGIMMFLPKTAWIGRSAFTRIPLVSHFLRMIHYIPVYRKDPIRSKKAVDHAIEKADQITIAIFPEGTRTHSGRLTPFKKGFVHIFRGSNLDILPVTINGFYDFFPRSRWELDYDAKLEVIVHKPIERDHLLGKTNEEIIEITKGVIESSLNFPSV